MAKSAYGAMAAFAAACLFNAAPASADIEMKAGCDGKWVARQSDRLATYMAYERQTLAHLNTSALRLRAHHNRKLAHVRLHGRLLAHATPRAVAAPVVVAAMSPRRETECVNLNCPQFILVGIGW